MSYLDYLAHHGIKNQKWGKTNGPPYPLSDDQRSAAENRSNPTSMSAKRLAKLGPDNRFRNSAKSTTTSGASEGTNLPRNATRSAAVRYELDKKRREKTTHKDVNQDRMEKFADKYGYDPSAREKITTPEEEKEEKKEKVAKKASSTTKKTAEQRVAEKAAEKAAKEAEKAAEKERKRIQDAEDRAMRVIDRLFSGNTTSRAMDSLLDELSEGWLNGKNFDAEDFKELAKDPKYKEMMEKMGTDSKGSDFYAKVIAQLGDSKDPKVKELRKKYEKLIKERHEEDAKQGYEDLEKLKKQMGADYKDQSLDRFSRSISAMTDFVTFMKDANPTEMNLARVRVLSYLEDKISWLNDNGSNAGDRTPTLKEKRNLQKVTEWLRKHGF